MDKKQRSLFKAKVSQVQLPYDKNNVSFQFNYRLNSEVAFCYLQAIADLSGGTFRDLGVLYGDVHRIEGDTKLFEYMEKLFNW